MFHAIFHIVFVFMIGFQIGKSQSDFRKYCKKKKKNYNAGNRSFRGVLRT